MLSKKLFYLIIASLCSLPALVSCGGSGTSDYSNSSGKPYELVVSIPQDMWDGEVGDTLRSVLLEPVHMLNQIEPQFDVVRINPAGLKGMVIRHRNILTVQTNPALEKPTSQAIYDTYAKPQIMVAISAPDTRSLVDYISGNRKEIQAIFNNAERDRAVSNAKRYHEQGISNEIYSMFGLKMNIPRGFVVKNRVGDNFLWIGYEFPAASQGVVVYSYPYTGREDFTPENMLHRRNQFLSNIPGASDGSYMSTSEYIEPEVTYMRIDNRPWAEMRGFWDMKGDFMGGPFVSYSGINTTTRQVVTVEGFLYSPRDHKRNMMRTLEHLIHSAYFPAQETPRQD